MNIISRIVNRKAAVARLEEAMKTVATHRPDFGHHDPDPEELELIYAEEAAVHELDLRAEYPVVRVATMPSGLSE